MLMLVSSVLATLNWILSCNLYTDTTYVSFATWSRIKINIFFNKIFIIKNLKSFILFLFCHFIQQFKSLNIKFPVEDNNEAQNQNEDLNEDQEPEITNYWTYNWGHRRWTGTPDHTVLATLYHNEVMGFCLAIYILIRIMYRNLRNQE
ncbi:hypothetical protein DERP_007018 [Dermatophagoides pteronyssinus]|uniref:Uncharacterized protein n=1 Tax=Dermatophagoides pteronyssinus TaxID=6956 RepID=A0ABQ8JUK4_DERPT|nr:hypothetical protein DERP_007018 [Dermatophagoides pteronyssinus]